MCTDVAFTSKSREPQMLTSFNFSGMSSYVEYVDIDVAAFNSGVTSWLAGGFTAVKEFLLFHSESIGSVIYLSCLTALTGARLFSTHQIQRSFKAWKVPNNACKRRDIDLSMSRSTEEFSDGENT